MENLSRVETREQRRRHPLLFIKVLEESFNIKFSLIDKAKILFNIFFQLS